MKLHPGAVIEQTLRLVRPIAEGGMGSVWVADHLVLGREVAVKVLAKPWADMPGAAARFLREAKITARVESPHVVRVLDCRLTQADEPYLVLELLHGETLERRVERRGPLSVYDLVDVLDQVCKALSATHRAGFVHRDLKPENVFLETNGRPAVKLLDFGVARPRDEAAWIDADRLPAGTPQYMSPEQMFAPESADERSDLFSLAAVAYFALTGRPPFAAESLSELYFAAHEASFPAPSSLRKELPASVDRFFERALARDPELRFADAPALSAAFREAVEGARRPSVPPAERSGDDDAPPSVRALPLRRRASGKAILALGAVTALIVLVARAAPDFKSASASIARSPGRATVAAAPATTGAPGEPAEPTSAATEP